MTKFSVSAVAGTLFVWDWWCFLSQVSKNADTLFKYLNPGGIVICLECILDKNFKMCVPDQQKGQSVPISGCNRHCCAPSHIYTAEGVLYVFTVHVLYNTGW